MEIGYNAVDHYHDWKEHPFDNDAYCPICGLWLSQIEKLAPENRGKP